MARGPADEGHDEEGRDVSPYRQKPDPVPPAPPAREPRESWMDRHFAFVLIASIVATTVVAAIVAYYDRQHPAPPKPCSSFADVPAKDLPARCTKIYDPDGGT